VNKLVLPLLYFLSLSSCGKSNAPEGVISEDKMVELMVDIHMAEGYVSSFPIHFDSSRKLYPLFETEVFRKHEIPDSVFLESLIYYMRDTRLMNRIYSRTIDSLSVREKFGNIEQ
jgi:hypothetical protein